MSDTTNMKKSTASILFSLVIGICVLGFTPKVLAQSCVTQYGGTVVCPPTSLTINKQVAKPLVSDKGGAATPVFVENLTAGDPTFGPDQLVLFRLTIKNGSNQNFAAVSVVDVLPAYLTFVSGPGSYDSAKRTLTFTLDNLVSGESRNVEILANTLAKESFPQDKSVFCVVNQANVSAGSFGDRDTSQLCLQLGVPPTTLPVAGFDDLVILLPFVGTGLGGLLLMKKRGLVA